MRKRIISFFTGLIVLSALTGCAMTPVRQHPDFASGKQKIKVVAILPADVEFRHLVFTGENERDSAREQAIASDLNATVGRLLEAKGYVIKEDLLKKAEAGDKQFNFDFEQFKNAYGQVYKELYAQPMVQEEQANKFKVGVGALANPFAQSCKADALLLIRYAGFDKSQGLIAKEVVGSALLAVLTGVVAVPAHNGGHIDLALIDGVSGDVLWTNAAGGPTASNASLNMALTKLPASNSTPLAPATQTAEAKTEATSPAPAVASANSTSSPSPASSSSAAAPAVP